MACFPPTSDKRRSAQGCLSVDGYSPTRRRRLVLKQPRIRALEILVKATTKTAQVRLNRQSPAYWRVIFDNPPLNLMGPEFVMELREIMTAIETDEHPKVVVFESAVEGFYLNHSDFLAKLENLTSIPQGPTGLEAWPDRRPARLPWRLRTRCWPSAG
jgi:hypothetical protein